MRDSNMKQKMQRVIMSGLMMKCGGGAVEK